MENAVWERLCLMRWCSFSDALLSCCSPLRNNKPVLGVIGCMAERLKSRLFEEKAVDIIAGPDALRSVPGLVDLFCQVENFGDCLLYTCALACSAGLMRNRGRIPDRSKT